MRLDATWARPRPGSLPLLVVLGTIPARTVVAPTKNPAAWLTTVATHICLDVLGSARSRRERYVGEWLPEPLPEPAEWARSEPAASTADPAGRVTLDESVSMALLVVLESMTPAERVAFILHDVFGYSFAEVAVIVGRTPAACRQLASSARRRVSASQAPRAPVPQQARIIKDFRRAWEAGDIGALVALLDPDATATGDGGGRNLAELRPVVGAQLIARFFAGRVRPGLTLQECTVNGQPGLVAEFNGETVAVCAFEVEGDRIKHIWAILNPDKLRPWFELGQLQ